MEKIILLVFTLLRLNASKFVVIHENNFQPVISNNNTSFIRIEKNVSLHQVSQLINSVDKENIYFSFTQHTWMAENKNFYNFGVSLPTYDSNNAFDHAQSCFRFTHTYKHTVANLIVSFMLQNVCLIIEENHCSLQFVRWLRTQLRSHVLEPQHIELTVVPLLAYTTTNRLFEQLYAAKATQVNLAVMLAPNRYFTMVYDVAVRLNLEITTHAWLIPDYVDQGGLVKLHRLIYFRRLHEAYAEVYDETVLPLLFRAYENARNQCPASIYRRKECIEWRLNEALVAAFDTHDEDETNELAVHERLFHVNGTVQKSVSKIEVHNQHMEVLVPGQIALLRSISTKKEQRSLRIVTIITHPFLFQTPDHYDSHTGKCYTGLLCKHHLGNGSMAPTCCYGFGATLFQHVVEQLNIEIDMYIVADGKYGGRKNGKWDGLIGDLVEGKADLAMAALTINKERSHYVDFTVPFMEQTIGIVTKPEAAVLGFFNWKFMAPLSTEVQVVMWVCAALMIMLTYCAENAVYLVRRNLFYAKGKYYSMVESFSYVGGIAMQRDLGAINPARWGARASAIVYAFGMVIFITTYTARLAAMSLQEEEKQPFKGSKDPRMRNPTDEFKFAVIRSTSHESFFNQSTVEVYRRMSRFMEPYNVRDSLEGIQRVKNGTLQALIDDYFFLHWYASNDDNCELRLNEDPLAGSWIGFGARKGLPLLQSINEVILRLKEDEIVTGIHRDWFTQFCQPQFFVTKKRQLDIPYLGGLIMVLLVTMIVCYPLLTLPEMFFHEKIKRPLSVYVQRRFTLSGENTFPSS